MMRLTAFILVVAFAVIASSQSLDEIFQGTSGGNPLETDLPQLSNYKHSSVYDPSYFDKKRAYLPTGPNSRSPVAVASDRSLLVYSVGNEPDTTKRQSTAPNTVAVFASWVDNENGFRLSWYHVQTIAPQCNSGAYGWALSLSANATHDILVVCDPWATVNDVETEYDANSVLVSVSGVCEYWSRAKGSEDGFALFETQSAQTFARGGSRLPTNPYYTNLFGFSVSLRGHHAAVGAPGTYDLNGVQVGAAYFFIRAGAGNLYQNEISLFRDTVPSLLGYDVSLSKTAEHGIVGNPTRTVNGVANVGAVRVYARVFDSLLGKNVYSLLTEIATATASANLNDYMGSGVAINSLGTPTFHTGIPYFDYTGTDNGATLRGYYAEGSGWQTRIAVLGAENFFVVLNDTASEDNYGRHVNYITYANGSAPFSAGGVSTPRVIVTCPGRNFAVSLQTGIVAQGETFRKIVSADFDDNVDDYAEFGLFAGGFDTLVGDDHTQLVATTAEWSVYLGYITCGSTGNYWGPTCAPCPENCAFGCSSGLSGNGECLPNPADSSKFCDVTSTHSYNGTKCEVECPLYCDSCTTDGECATCPQAKAGYYCNISCPAQCPLTSGSCNDGPSGNGKCNLCNRNYYGEDCTPCNVEGVGCAAGACNDGGLGSAGYGVNVTAKRVLIGADDITVGLNDGSCRACHVPQYQYGAYCNYTCLDRPCAPLYDDGGNLLLLSHCSVGISANGTCLTCEANEWGPNCEGCSPNCADDGTVNVDCNDGADANGHCFICDSGIWGPFCSKECSETCGYNNELEASCSDGPAVEATGLCLNCSVGYYGDYCTNCDVDCNGPCDDGLTGNGDCDGDCYPNRWGSQCLSCPANCSTNCNATKDGDGRCLACGSNRIYGYGCDSICSSLCLTCSNGPFGNGECTACPLNMWDGDCSTPCPANCQDPGPNQRTCDDDIDGSGVCLDCPPTRYGPQCDGVCSGLCATCDKGPEGTGACLTCPADKYDVNCSSTCLCESGCDAGIEGDGTCDSCPAGMAGSKCDIPCPAGCATCDEDVEGTGTCLTCPEGVYDTACDKNCLCETDDDCNDDINGDGTCTACAAGTYGSKCESTCSPNCATCDDGPDGVGSCESCPAGTFGEFCTLTSSCVSGACVSCGTTSDDDSCTEGPCPAGYHGPNCKTQWDSTRYETCASNTSAGGPYDCVCKTTGAIDRIYGPDCESCLATCENGPCDYGVSGDGSCTDCYDGYYGASCSECSCVDGICDDGLDGDGKCTDCNSADTYGENCDSVCDLPTGCSECSNGPSGNGDCTACSANYFGANCDPCPAGCPTNCFDGMGGNGTCKACSSDTVYGSTCNSQCDTSCLTCSNGPSGDGSCTECPDYFYGADCESSCPAGCPTNCDDGLGGDGTCQSCGSNTTYGPECDQTCDTACAVCSSGPDGDGSCLQCPQGKFGANCEGSCTSSCSLDCDDGVGGTGACGTCNPGAYGSNCTQFCPNGCPNNLTCNDGPSGNGTCFACNGTNRYGPSCSSLCSANCASCSNGLTGTGACVTCQPNRYGASCNNTCPAGCATDCNDGPTGTGACESCPTGRYGSTCALNCSAGCATCEDGPSGDGSCESCNDGFYGASCTACTCNQGETCDDGITGSGSCTAGSDTPSGSGPIDNVPAPANNPNPPTETAASSVMVSLVLVALALLMAFN